MVLRDSPHLNPAQTVPFRLRIEGHWIRIDEQLLRAHPGGGAILTYRNLDATDVFHAFHAGSKRAYTWLQKYREGADNEEEYGPINKLEEEQHRNPPEAEKHFLNVNMGHFKMNAEQNLKVCQSFAKLRIKVREQRMLNADNQFYFKKFAEAIALIGVALFLQSVECFVFSALFMGLAWQQLGWMIHDYSHHQHFKTNRTWNDVCGYICGNLLQGFSLGGWKEQHNVHHAATNVDGRDGDLDLLPLWATIGTQLEHIDGKSLIARMLPFQHLYWGIALPLLRLSWLIQSIQFVAHMNSNFYDIYRQRAFVEQSMLVLHWTLMIVQYYFFPNYQIRIQYFFISQLFAGFLLAHVVTYNHYSTDKFPHDDPILANYACLQLYTTRNMKPGMFVDWLWGGLNYQIEHHLFPTMPRHNLKKIMPLVKQFCEENELPYMVDDYFTGFRYTIEQLRNVAQIASQRYHLQKST